MTTSYHVEPQRSTGCGWIACEPHQAQRWAVVERTVYSAQGITSRQRKVISTWPKIKLAYIEYDILTRKTRSMLRPTLGQRFIRTGRKIIASSK